MHTTVSALVPDVIAPPQAAPEIPVAVEPPPVRWRFATRIVFRVCAIYFGLYVLMTQMFFSLFPWPWGGVPGPGQIPALRTFTAWVATDVFKFPKPLTLLSGSGDKPYDYAFVAVLLVFSVVVTALWSILDRRRPSYVGFHKWFRVFLRFGLGGTMVTYGMIKAFPMQMPYPNLTRLLEPYGHFSLMGVLWAKIGASPAYESFTGLVELTAGILLFVPGLTTLGALLALATTTQVFMLNMTYDVPVKLFSLQLMLISLFLLAPDARRLFDAVVLGRAAGASTVPPLARTRRWRAIAIGAQLAMAAWIVGVSFNANFQRFKTSGLNAPKPPLYGIWIVDRMTIDGVERAPLVTDYDRFRRVVIQSGVSMSLQRMDDTFAPYGTKVDPAAKTIALTKSTSPPLTPNPNLVPAGQLTFQQPASDRLILDGQIDGRKVRMEMTSYDRGNFRLVQGKFRWVQDLPFNR
jgi:hypothetical protein